MIKLRHLLSENVQLATKLYGNKLEAADIEWLDRVTGGKKDHTYKTLVELMLEDKQSYARWNLQQWQDAYAQLLNYNKNIFPIEGFSFDSPIQSVYKKTLTDRAKVLRTIGKWPKFALRNLRGDIRLPRQSFSKVLDRVDYIDNHLGFLENKTDDQKLVILKKIFSSDHPTFEDVLDYVEEKENLIAGTFTLSKDDLAQIIKKHDYDLKVVYDKGNIVIVDVTGQPGMKALGCNSLWCFSYGSEYGKAGEHFDHYSFNGHVYTIIDFSIPPTDKSFMHVVTKPFQNASEDSPGIYNMANEEEYGDPESIVKHLTGDASALKVFDWDLFGEPAEWPEKEPSKV
jgi:hypothetical protein